MTLTSRQCKILFWICRRQGIQVRELAAYFNVVPQTIHGDIGGIYQLFGLTQIPDGHEKRRILYERVCPIHINLVANPDLTCDDRLFIQGEPAPPDRETMRIVIHDLNSGLFDPPRPTTGPSKSSEQSKRKHEPARKGIKPKEPRRWVPILSLTLLVLIFAALVVVILLLLQLLMRG